MNGCTYASDCGQGESCVNGTCLPISKATTSGCSVDPDCPAERPFCDQVFGVCRECTMNAHCPTEWTCDRGACVDHRVECAHDGMCRPPDTVCNDEQCVPGCNTPGSPIACSGNTICDATTGRCVAKNGCRIDFDCAPPQSICINGGQCSAGCLATGCATGERCNDNTGRCEPESIGRTCSGDGECAPPTTVCDDGTCKPGCARPNGIACGALEICDGGTGRCVPSPTCITDAECPSIAPICGASGRCEPGCHQAGGSCPSGMACNTTTGRCATNACSADAHCFSPTPMCDLSTDVCYGCSSESDCGGSTPYCDVARGACYGCRSNAECGGATPVCNVSLGVCVGCVSNADCPSSYPICDASSATCRGCTANADCGGNAPVCHLPSGVCVGCVSNADCGGNTPVCEVASGACRGCTSNAECGGATPVCHVPSGLCLECVTNADCPASEPTCDSATGTCVLLPPQPLGASCTSDAECESEVCWNVGSGGRCVRSCNKPADCDNGTTCYMLNGARMCLNPQTAPPQAEDIECTRNSDCTGGNLCVWIEDAPGHFDQVCRGPVGNNAPQTQCTAGNQCQNGVCTAGVNTGGAYCRYTCATNRDCPSNFACLYIDYEGQSYTQAVKACLPVQSPNPPVCGVDNDCGSSQVCGLFDEGASGGFYYWSNVCLNR